MAIRILTMGEILVLHFLPFCPSSLVMRLEFLSVPLGTLCGLSYSYSLDTKALPKKFFVFLGTPLPFFSLAFLVLPLYHLTLLLNTAIVVSGINFIPIFFQIFRIAMKRELGYGLLATSMVALLGFAFHDVLFALNFISTGYLLPFGLILFATLQALYLSMGYASEINQSESELAMAKHQLIQSEKLSTLGIMMAGISHEINSPLAAVQSSSGSFVGSLEEFIMGIRGSGLSDKDWDFLTFLVSQSINKPQNLSTRVVRNLKKSLLVLLESRQSANAENWSEILANLGMEQLPPNVWEAVDSDHSKTILFLAELLLRLTETSKTIELASGRAGKIVKSLKSFTHFDPNSPKILADIHEGLDIVLTIFANAFKKGIDLKTHFGELPKLLCFPDELNQIWTNLIQNAIQAMKGEGSLSITTTTINRDNQTFVSVSFQDSGPGIPDSLRQKIFDPFFTTKSMGEGTGLGLHITKQILEKHKGKVELDSSPQGTNFTILLPMSPHED